MARKKAPDEQKAANPVSYRFSAQTTARLERLAGQYEVTKTALLEAGLAIIEYQLERDTSRKVKALIGARKKSDPAP